MTNMLEPRFDVVIYHRASRKVESLAGVALRRWNGTGRGYNTADLRKDTVEDRINDSYSVAIVPTGTVKVGDVLPTDD